MPSVSSKTLRSQQLNQLITRLSANYVAHRPAIQRILNAAFALYVVGSTYRGLSARPSAPKRDKGKGKRKDDEPGKPPKVAVDALFYRRLSEILRIVIPGIRSKEALLLLMHSTLLVSRTFLSLYVANLDGVCVTLASLRVVCMG